MGIVQGTRTCSYYWLVVVDNHERVSTQLKYTKRKFYILIKQLTLNTIFVRLWLTWKAKQNWLTNQSNSSRRNVSTSWMTEIPSENAQKIWVSDTKCQTVRIIFIKEAFISPQIFIGALAGTIWFSEGLATSLANNSGVVLLRQRISSQIYFFKTWEIWML